MQLTTNNPLVVIGAGNAGAQAAVREENVF
jgi:succinate dehydrogenase/fumarate reductase flavoprotein subunit